MTLTWYNSTIEIAWDIFITLVDYCLHHLVDNVEINIYTHDYIKMEIIVLYNSRHQLSISWSQISVYWLRYHVASKLNLPPSHAYPIDAVKCSNTIQLSPNSHVFIQKSQYYNTFMNIWNISIDIHKKWKI